MQDRKHNYHDSLWLLSVKWLLINWPVNLTRHRHTFVWCVAVSFFHRWAMSRGTPTTSLSSGCGLCLQFGLTLPDGLINNLEVLQQRQEPRLRDTGELLRGKNPFWETCLDPDEDFYRFWTLLNVGCHMVEAPDPPLVGSNLKPISQFINSMQCMTLVLIWWLALKVRDALFYTVEEGMWRSS